MTLLTVILIVIAVGVALWIVNTWIPLAHRSAANGVILGFVGLWVIVKFLGPYLSQIRL